MSVALRKHGLIWAEFELVPSALEKVVTLRMRKPGGPYINLLQMTVVGDNLLYSSAASKPVLGQEKGTELTDGKEPA